MGQVCCLIFAVVNSNDNSAAKIAEYLLKIKAVKLKPDAPFTWASGWKSPIYCDNRLVLSFPEIRNDIIQAFVSLIQTRLPGADAVVGVATAGIPHGVLIADRLNLPFAYVRPEPKKHGLGKQLEGELPPGSKVVVIEDLISTGKSSLAAIEALRKESIDVLGLAAVFTYEFQIARDAFVSADCPFFTLSNYSILIESAEKAGYIQPHQLKSLIDWKTNPAEWMASH